MKITSVKSPAALAAYDLWFRAEVQEALDDKRPAIPEEEVEGYFV